METGGGFSTYGPVMLTSEYHIIGGKGGVEALSLGFVLSFQQLKRAAFSTDGKQVFTDLWQ